ncbi:MAG: T9SS type A sorting domain-containing protein [Ignavibacteria bacterium]|nr:T9SS type A sorting domain-containing protein [Ignavibacteria bacterium]MCU7497800.1 T9SS type A sorting domain-containing protein [Ignavibacteria bacterium]MCU7511081.1 T9SS type A sorting domain-containing protein [Ignavibacteria bacterium]MCU7518628.1 T9SS type A sorting domain-containing protein [Ignavibacteria bacterium]MCU7522969.1 T9SS type A sorting domain-containing protein [Ignavibacteria bacterium]
MRQNLIFQAVYSGPIFEQRPFNPTTSISYSIPEQFLVELKVYDLLSRQISTLINKEQSAGEYKFQFDGSSLLTGMYVYSIQAGEFRVSKIPILIKQL